MSSSHVLVATALDGPSDVALFRGAGLSRSLALPLRLLHVLWEPPEASGGPSPTRAANARAIVVDWAARLGVMNADVVVVGIRDGHGATCSALLSSERRTLVAVPLDS